MSEPLKQSSMNSVFNNVHAGLIGDDEIDVSEILLDLAKLISDSEWWRQFPSVCWGKKRKRSALDSPPSTTTTSPPSPPCRLPEIERHVLKILKTKNKKGETAAAAATSPSTPLSFSPSESDEQKSSKQSMKSNYKKKTKEELLEIIDGLNHNRELLKGELNTVRSKHLKLSATNLELKAKKQEISFVQKAEKNPQLGMNGVYIQQQQFLMDYKAFYESYGQRTPNGTSPYHGIRLVNLGPRGIPDLNVCAEESCVLGASSSSQPLNLMSKLMMDNSSRLRAADARRRRIMKIKEVRNQGRSQSQRHPGP